VARLMHAECTGSLSRRQQFAGTRAGRIEISAQNHNFAVDPKTLPADIEVSHINLNDGTCAGMLARPLKAMGIQYHPEASPGPHDSDVCFEQFIEMMKAERGVAVAGAA
jgi:carbamoyl-phosphate synthase small subunit